MKGLIAFILIPLLGQGQSNFRAFTLTLSLKLVKPIDKVYFRYSVEGNVIVDSVQYQEKQFSFTGKIDEPTHADLRVKFKNQKDADAEEIADMELFLEPGKMHLVAKDSLSNNEVTGSNANVDFLKIQQQLKAFQDRNIAVNERYNSAAQKNDKVALKQVLQDANALDAEIREKVYKSFAINNPHSPVALYAASQYAGYSIEHPDEADQLFLSLPVKTKKLPSAIILKKQIEIAKKTAIGHFAADFSQTDTLGHPLSLSSFKGKYVLLDFWASWCRPCRYESPNLVSSFSKYKDKNFTILSVSLDRPGQKESWLKAIRDDGLYWNHVSDLKFWNNAVATQYGIRDIPQNLLLDPQGKIIAKNLRGADLEEKLAEIIPN